MLLGKAYEATPNWEAFSTYGIVQNFLRNIKKRPINW
jgi:hypothetical protein